MSLNSNEFVRAASAKRIPGWLIKSLLLVAILWVFFILTGRILLHLTIEQIIELTNTKIDIGSIDYNFDGSVLIEKLVVRPPQKIGDEDAILKAKKVYARFGIGSLLLLRPRLKEISINNFVFNAQHDLDTNRWNVATLKSGIPAGGPGKIPLIRLERGTLRYSKVSNGRLKVIAAVPIDAKFGPAEKTQDGYSFNITTAKRAGFGKSTLTGSWKPGRITISGGISSADILAFERTWAINLLNAELNYDQSNSYSLKLKIKDLLGTYRPVGGTFALDKPASLKKFRAFAALQRFFHRYRPAGQVDIELEASGNLKQLAESTLSGKVHCKNITICDRRFPYPVEHLAGRIDFTEKSASLNNLCGRHNDVKLFFNGWSKDFAPNWQYQIRITSDDMALDNDLYTALTTRQKKLWSAFSPSGLAAIDYRLNRRSKTDKKKILAVKLLDAEATYRRFPYPLKNLTGMLLFDRENITISDVLSQSNGRKITLNGMVTACNTDRPIYDVSVKAEDIPLDETLAEVLLQAEQHFYRRFCLASQGKGLVSLTGRIWTTEKAQQPSYSLSLYTEQVQLNDDLFALLPTSLQKIVSEMQPKGKINLSADLNKADTDNHPDYKITVDCLGNSLNFDQFPYPLKDITGSVMITKDSINLRGITATPADNVRITPETSTIKINGQMALADDALTSGWFQLDANDISFDEQLGIALPEGVRLFYTGLSPTGRFDVNSVNIEISNDDNGEKCVDFTGAVKFKDCNFNISDTVTELDAVVETKGLYKTGDGFSNGQIGLIADALRIKGKFLTALEADIDYDQGRRNWLARNLIADCYGGRLAGKFELKQPAEAPSEFILQIGFDNIDLKQFLSDTKPKESPGNNYSSGKMSGSLSIGGPTGDPSSRIGRCRLKITNMQVGKLSPLAKLLHVLKLTEPKDFAFDRMFIDSYIKHDKLFFQKFDLSGEAVAFNGSGWMDLQTRDVDLVLFARGRRLATAEPSILQSLTDVLGCAVVRMEVTGNVYDPDVETKTLPVIGDSLNIFGTKPDTSKL